MDIDTIGKVIFILFTMAAMIEFKGNDFSLDYPPENIGHSAQTSSTESLSASRKEQLTSSKFAPPLSFYRNDLEGKIPFSRNENTKQLGTKSKDTDINLASKDLPETPNQVRPTLPTNVSPPTAPGAVSVKIHN